MISMPKSTINVISDWFFPMMCKSCGESLDAGDLACTDCLNNLSQTHYGNWVESISCSDGIDEVYSCWFFDDELQQIIHLLKYSDYARIGTQLGKRMAETISIENSGSIDLMIPIPLHTIKIRKRGYNQADFIAKGISKVWNLPVTADAVHRSKFTESQTQLNRDERIQNLTGAIEVRKNVTGKTCILVDDVLTTGSTMSSTALALKNNGAKKVIAFTCATPRPVSAS